MKNFPDTAQGARDALASMSTVKKDRIARSTAEADPVVEGVWQLTLPSGRAFIVYLGGYRDPFGQVREDDTFEESQPSRRERREEGL